jgi:multiple sugar transport system permease protein
VFRYVLVGLALLIVLFPIWWMVLAAFKLPADYMSIPPRWIPREFTLVHFIAVIQLQGYTAFKNSAIIGIGATLLSLVIGTLAAYSLARFNTGGHNFSFWLISQRLMPPVVVIIPFFMAMRFLGLVDSHLGLIILYTMFNLPFVIWMMRSYISEVPQEVEESALVDGAGRLDVLRLITLPLVLPGLIATGTFAFIFSWSEFLFALILTRNNAFTLPVTIGGYFGGQGTVAGPGAALCVVATLPLFVMGMLVQKHFVRGLTLGAVRG